MPEPGNHHRGTDPRSSAPGARVSRRRALQLGGGVGIAGLLAACGSAADGATAAPDAGGADAGPVTGQAAEAQLTDMLDRAPRCPMTAEETQGPYWFDVEDVRSDVREDRAGVPMRLALRVQDVARCTSDPAAGAVPDAVVEIWQCDAMGVYSGFRNGLSAQAPDDSGAPTAGPVSDGGYSAGDVESVPSGDATFLRGAQVTDADGIVRFTSIYPGWYSGRAVHVHIKVHVDKRTVLTTQLYFDDGLTDAILSSEDPYSLRGPRDTRNGADAIYDPTGLSVAKRYGDGVLAALNLGIDL